MTAFAHWCNRSPLAAALIALFVISVATLLCAPFAHAADHYELRCTNGSIVFSESEIVLETPDAVDAHGYCPPLTCDKYVTAGPVIDGYYDALHDFLTFTVPPTLDSADYAIVFAVTRSDATCRISYRSGSALGAAQKEPRLPKRFPRAAPATSPATPWSASPVGAAHSTEDR